MCLDISCYVRTFCAFQNFIVNIWVWPAIAIQESKVRGSPEWRKGRQSLLVMGIDPGTRTMVTGCYQGDSLASPKIFRYVISESLCKYEMLWKFCNESNSLALERILASQTGNTSETKPVIQLFEGVLRRRKCMGKMYWTYVIHVHRNALWSRTSIRSCQVTAFIALQLSINTVLPWYWHEGTCQVA